MAKEAISRVIHSFNSCLSGICSYVDSIGL